MRAYDTVLKSLLQAPQNSIFERITGAKIGRWLNVEFPEVQQTRVDMLGETADRQRLVGMEFQSTNDATIPLRMAILARHRDRRETIRRILARIATLEGSSRDMAFKKLTILAGLRE